MSMMLMVQALKAKVGSPLRKLVLVKLADQANDNGECWPSYQTVADACEMVLPASKCARISAHCLSNCWVMLPPKI